MVERRRRTLGEQLGGDPPEGVRALPEDDQQALADLIGDARRAQGTALAKAGEDGLKYVPALLRGAVRKAVGL